MKNTLSNLFKRRHEKKERARLNPGLSIFRLKKLEPEILAKFERLYLLFNQNIRVWEELDRSELTYAEPEANHYKITFSTNGDYIPIYEEMLNVINDNSDSDFPLIQMQIDEAIDSLSEQRVKIVEIDLYAPIDELIRVVEESRNLNSANKTQ